MGDTIEKMAEEFKIAYPLTYDAIYNKGRNDMAKETYSNLMAEISLLTSSDMSKENLYKFAHRVTEFAEKLKE